MYPLQEDIKHENPTSFPTISILLHNLKAKDVQEAEDRLIKIVIDHNTNFVASMAMQWSLATIDLIFIFNHQKTLHSNNSEQPFSNSIHSNKNAMMATHSPDDSWFLDTGATHHLSNNSNLSHTLPYQGTDQVTISNGKRLTISQVGSKTLHTHTKPSIYKPFFMCLTLQQIS